MWPFAVTAMLLNPTLPNRESGTTSHADCVRQSEGASAIHSAELVSICCWTVTLAEYRFPVVRLARLIVTVWPRMTTAAANDGVEA